LTSEGIFCSCKREGKGCIKGKTRGMVRRTRKKQKPGLVLGLPALWVLEAKTRRNGLLKKKKKSEKIKKKQGMFAEGEGTGSATRRGTGRARAQREKKKRHGKNPLGRACARIAWERTVSAREFPNCGEKKQNKRNGLRQDTRAKGESHQGNTKGHKRREKEELSNKGKRGPTQRECPTVCASFEVAKNRVVVRGKDEPEKGKKTA